MQVGGNYYNTCSNVVFADLHHRGGRIFCKACRTYHGDELIHWSGHKGEISECDISYAWGDAFDESETEEPDVEWLLFATSLQKYEPPVIKHVALCNHIVYTYDNYQPRLCAKCSDIEGREERYG
jgi:hypothetical protein